MRNKFLLNSLKQLRKCYLLRLQQLQDVLSHQADHVDPIKE